MTDTFMPESVLFDCPFLFSHRESALPADLRPGRRVCQIVLIINRCRGTRATLEQLHVLDWACRSAESRQLFLRCLKRGRGPDLPCVRFDPSLNRALDWGVGYGVLCTTTSGRFENEGPSDRLAQYRVWLTERGNRAARTIESIPDCFTIERALLASVGGKITQAFVRPFLRWELTS
jgi:hypothetical protein